MRLIFSDDRPDVFVGHLIHEPQPEVLKSLLGDRFGVSGVSPVYDIGLQVSPSTDTKSPKSGQRPSDIHTHTHIHSRNDTNDNNDNDRDDKDDDNDVIVVVFVAVVVAIVVIVVIFVHET